MIERTRRTARMLAPLALLSAALLLAGCGSGDTPAAPQPPQPGSTQAPAQPGRPGVGVPQALRNCTAQANDPATMTRVLAAAKPGDRICLSGDMGATRITVTNSGTPDRPITVLGGGKTTVGGVTIEASNVTVDGVHAEKPEAPGFSLGGNNLSITNSSVHQPEGGDGDGIRFWGSNITIAHNTVTDTRGHTKRHADCMQTFATDEENPASQDITIDSNRCERIDNICLIAEGPNSEAGDGSGDGRSTRFAFTNNYCDNRADQAVFLDDISNATITGNEIVGRIPKAFALQNNSGGAVIKNNHLASSVGFEVGMDDSSESNYQGPEPGGAP
jgi:hypothetical protein